MSIQCSLKEIQNHESGTSTGLRPATIANEALSTDLSCITTAVNYEVGSVFGLVHVFHTVCYHELDRNSRNDSYARCPNMSSQSMNNTINYSYGLAGDCSPKVLRLNVCIAKRKISSLHTHDFLTRTWKVSLTEHHRASDALASPRYPSLHLF